MILNKSKKQKDNIVLNSLNDRSFPRTIDKSMVDYTTFLSEIDFYRSYNVFSYGFLPIDIDCYRIPPMIGLLIDYAWHILWRYPLKEIHGDNLHLFQAIRVLKRFSL